MTSEFGECPTGHKHPDERLVIAVCSVAGIALAAFVALTWLRPAPGVGMRLTVIGLAALVGLGSVAWLLFANPNC